MRIRELDIYVAAYILLIRDDWIFSKLAKWLSMSPSEVHASTIRMSQNRFYDVNSKKIRKEPFLEFAIHGLKYVFPIVEGRVTRGYPTSYAVAPLNTLISSENDLPPVWPHAEGTVKGYAVAPLHPSAPIVALKNPQFYTLLSLLDAIRGSRIRERSLACDLLTQLVNSL